MPALTSYSKEQICEMLISRLKASEESASKLLATLRVIAEMSDNEQMRTAAQKAIKEYEE